MSSKDASNKDPIVVISSIAIIKPKVRCLFSEILMPIISIESLCQTEIIYKWGTNSYLLRGGPK